MVSDHGDGREPSADRWRRLGLIVRVVVLVWVGMVVLLALTQRSMLYFPSRQDPAALERLAAGHGFEPWRDPEGQVIGYRSHAAPDDPRPALAVLVSHGNAGYALHRADYATFLRAAAPDHAVSLYLLEYPGYGGRPGSPSQEALLAAAGEALAAIPDNQPVILLGESIGTGVATGTAARFPDRVDGLLLLTPFDSLVNVARHHYPLLPVGWILRDRYPSAEWLGAFDGPVAIIVAARDTIVPAAFGRALYESYHGPKKLIEDSTADHNDLLHTLPASAWREALEFLLQPR